MLKKACARLSPTEQRLGHARRERLRRGWARKDGGWVGMVGGRGGRAGGEGGGVFEELVLAHGWCGGRLRRGEGRGVRGRGGEAARVE